ncbi:16010_t:CDS:2 [Funneliformis mosseae]|uniref:16010_t:CDS:1 n=1 Tax=Funneliformis mosseae TaxID=27381 RepID=A0A9N9CQT5_FUNMO|nr:16010_t:CDS:2 [Funneliformis mosseae]
MLISLSKLTCSSRNCLIITSPAFRRDEVRPAVVVLLLRRAAYGAGTASGSSPLSGSIIPIVSID